MKVFISYGKEDIGQAKRLYNDLKQAGYNPWLDAESLFGGQKWRSAIYNAIRDSRFFIALLSLSSVNRRGFVNSEISEALDVLKEYPDNDIYLVPVRLEKCKPNHESLQELHWIDLFPKWSEGMRNLLKSLSYSRDKNGSSPVKAFVQVRLKPGNLSPNKLQDFVQNIPNVSQAEVVYGIYDLCLTIRANDIYGLNESLSQINSLPVVDSTTTSLSAGPIEGFHA